VDPEAHGSCPGENRCVWYKASPVQACIGCHFNLGHRAEDGDETNFLIFADWIQHLCRLEAALQITHVPESALTADELRGLILLRNESHDVSQMIAEQKQRDYEQKLERERNAKNR